MPGSSEAESAPSGIKDEHGPNFRLVLSKERNLFCFNLFQNLLEIFRKEEHEHLFLVEWKRWVSWWWVSAGRDPNKSSKWKYIFKKLCLFRFYKEWPYRKGWGAWTPHENWTSPGAQTVKMSVGFLGWEDLLEKEMATRCSILAWRTPWTEEPGGLPGVEKSWIRLSD